MSAAASYVRRSTAENVVVGAGADDLILLLAQVVPRAGTRAAIDAADVRAVPDRDHAARGGRRRRRRADADLHWVCNPNNPTGELGRARGDRGARRAARRGRSSSPTRRTSSTARRSCAPWVDELPNLVVLRTLSKAFGFASLRVGYALAHPDTAALLTERRAPAPIAGPAAAIASAALREPAARRRRGDDRRARARARGARGRRVRLSSRPRRTSSTSGPTSRSPRRSSAQGIVVRAFPDGIRISIRRPSENDVLLRALGAEPGDGAGREATVLRTTTETALRLTLSLDGTGRNRVETGIGFVDHLLTLLAFHAGFDLELAAGGRPRRRRAPHGRGRPRGARRRRSRRRSGRARASTRYGSAVVPMDEARATAAVDLVRRPHAEIALTFGGDRVGALAVSLLAHALERFAIEAGCTVHVEAAGSDDHHVAEAAYKALGQALRQAVALAGERDPLDEGRRVKVVIADYGAGNLRSLSSALARAGVEPVVTTDADAVRDAPLAADRRGRARRERGAPGSRATASTTRCAPASTPGGPSRGSASGCSSCSRRARREARGSACSRARSGGSARVACRTWAGTRSRRRGRARSSTASTVPTSTSRTASPSSRPTTAVTIATVDHDGPVVAAVESGPVAGVQFHPERSAAAGARVLENLAAMVKKRVIPCLDVADGRVVKGVNFREPPRDGGARRARAPLLGARRGRARLPRHHRDPRGARADPRRRSAVPRTS